MNNRISRRSLVLTTPLAAGLLTKPFGREPGLDEPFRYCLNTSTIRGQDLSLPAIIKIASEAGYSGIEPWLGEIRKYQQEGGRLSDLKKLISDTGLRVESAIGFAPWLINDPQRRSRALDEAERDMDLVRQIGGERIAAPPAGVDGPVDLAVAATRYRALLERGVNTGVIPQLELWGHSKAIYRLGQVAYIAIESGHKDACVLPDVYHIYRGGSDYSGLQLISGASIHVFHVNDYPAIAAERIGDADRVYPGDGVAPLTNIFRTLYQTGFRGAISLELFNREYWQQPASQVAKRGLQKMKQAVAAALPK